MDAHPEMDHFNDPTGNFTDDVPILDMSVPQEWEEDLNWDSDASI
jgi:hypothetical protein